MNLSQDPLTNAQLLVGIYGAVVGCFVLLVGLALTYRNKKNKKCAGNTKSETTLTQKQQ